MKTVIYSCCFVPCEWIVAHELQPRKIMPGGCPPDATGSIEGICTYVRAFADSVCADKHADAVVVTTVCDQMRRVPELIARISDIPIFLMNVPCTWGTSESWRLYVEELERLGKFLVRLGGKSPPGNRLSEVMLQYEALRLQLADSRQTAPSKQYARGILAIAEGNPLAHIGDDFARDAAGIPVGIVGGELRSDDLKVFDMVEHTGGRIVLDATDTGERTLPGSFDRRNIRSDPLMELANAYFGTIPHVFRRPNSGLYEYLKLQILERGIRGIIFRRYQWCDIWNAELQRLRDWAGVPILDLDLGCEGDDLARSAGRVEALMEMLD